MTDQNTPLPSLSPRHERFVLEYLKDANATRAYVRAGFSPRGAQPSASRLLRRPEIEAAIAAGRQRIAKALELSVERIGREYAQIAFANIDDYVSVEADGRLRIDLEKASQAQRAGIVELKVSNHSKPEQQVTLKLGKLQALAALTDRIGLFAKKPEPVKPSVDRDGYERTIAKLRDDLEDAMLSQGDAEDERDDALAMLAEAQAKLAEAGLDGPSAEPPDDSCLSHNDFFPSPRDGGEKVPSAGEADDGLPGATTSAVVMETPQSPSSALRAPSPRMRREKENHSNPCATAAPEEPPQPPPHVPGAGHGTIVWNATRQPPSEPTWHDILRQGARFPGG